MVTVAVGVWVVTVVEITLVVDDDVSMVTVAVETVDVDGYNVDDVDTLDDKVDVLGTGILDDGVGDMVVTDV